MPERGRLVRPALPIEEAYYMEANPFGHGLEVGGRAARAPAGSTFFWPFVVTCHSQRAGRPSPWWNGRLTSGAHILAHNRADKLWSHQNPLDRRPSAFARRAQGDRWDYSMPCEARA